MNTVNTADTTAELYPSFQHVNCTVTDPVPVVVTETVRDEPEPDTDTDADNPD